jgi:hypothetical protein
VVATSTLLVVVAVSLLITRVATVILTATGMSRESARFQARSAFTGSGFTTRESELVVDHPIRRRVISVLMLFGSAGVVAVVASTILGFSAGSGTARGWRLLELVAGLLVLVAVSRSDRVDRRLTAAISYLLRRFTRLPTRDVASLLDLAGDYSVNELAIREGDWLAGHTLAELALRDEGVVVLGVTRSDGHYVAAPEGETVLNPGDVLVVYGRDDALAELDDRAAGPVGDLAHADAVRRHREVTRTERDTGAEAYPVEPDHERVRKGG